MKEVKIKKARALLQKSIRGELRRTMYSQSYRTMSESEFWKKTALQQQVLLHAKNKT